MSKISGTLIITSVMGLIGIGMYPIGKRNTERQDFFREREKTTHYCGDTDKNGIITHIEKGELDLEIVSRLEGHFDSSMSAFFSSTNWPRDRQGERIPTETLRDAYRNHRIEQTKQAEFDHKTRYQG